MGYIMPGYTPQSEIQRRQALVESLSRRADKPGFGGLFDAFRGGREQRALSDANMENSNIQSAETQALLQAMQNNAGGGLQGPTQGGGQPNLNLQTPELQSMQLRRAMGQQGVEQAEAQRLKELEEQRIRDDQIYQRDRFDASVDKGVAHQDRMALERLKQEKGPSGSASARQMAPSAILDENNNQIGSYQENTQGAPAMYSLSGDVWTDLPAGAKVVRNSGFAGYNPNVIDAASSSQASAAGEQRSAVQRSEQDVINEFQGREARGKLDMAKSNQEVTIDAIDRLLGHPGLPKITGKSHYNPLNLVPGEARDATILLRQLASRTFVDALAAMRAASPTGGAVGNVSDREGDKLENVIAALSDSTLSDDEMVFQLNLAKEIINRFNTDSQAAWEGQFGASAVEASADAGARPSSSGRFQVEEI
jgi:hypothetical protein